MESRQPFRSISRWFSGCSDPIGHFWKCREYDSGEASRRSKPRGKNRKNQRGIGFSLRMPNACDGADDFQVVMPQLGPCACAICGTSPTKSRPCWHLDSAIAEKKRGESDPTFEALLTNEADKLEQASGKVQQ